MTSSTPNWHVRQWRDLARGPEYLPPHLTVSTARAASPSPVTASTVLVGPKSDWRGSDLATSAPPPRSTIPLTRLLDAVEDAQRSDVHARVSGHLNHDKVFVPLRTMPVAAAAAASELRPVPPIAPKSAGAEHDGVATAAARPSVSSLPGTVPLPPPAPDVALVGTASALVRSMRPDRAAALLYRLNEDLGHDTALLARVLVAGRCFDQVIQEFKSFSPLLSAIKSVYDQVTDQYEHDLSDLDQLKRQLLAATALHQEKAAEHRSWRSKYRAAAAERDKLAQQVAALTAQLQTLQVVPEDVREADANLGVDESRPCHDGATLLDDGADGMQGRDAENTGSPAEELADLGDVEAAADREDHGGPELDGAVD
ncbi:hypothetical protein AMAG_00741 [Allomyces macrogynus ATCC 38327]|uniref:Translin-associated factor X-interacting protein 1 N-terminal domain-containing protein n=1 Tax=Allomyces macrogynus (strain ATCC 38327) TaxID=578462 RepID=A0A0L0RWK9_ALLM3|nr:hypothetical protein AMAG_00741 [Allomyces macrogynus ATCC 38327]|eukprot:KNE54787.1 hypothetical protein AMAG_00741 [Allomyces macrogynus ATCC 38327]